MTLRQLSVLFLLLAARTPPEVHATDVCSHSEGLDVVFGLDASKSVKGAGWSKIVESTNRVIDELIARDSGKTRIGLFFFNKGTQGRGWPPLSYLTTDKASVKQALSDVNYFQIDGDRTDITSAFIWADKIFAEGGRRAGVPQAFALVTDGVPHSSSAWCNGGQTQWWDGGANAKAAYQERHASAAACRHVEDHPCRSDPNEECHSDCRCSLLFADFFNANEFFSSSTNTAYSTTVVGIPNVNHDSQIFRSMLRAFASSSDRYVDAESFDELASVEEQWVEKICEHDLDDGGTNTCEACSANRRRMKEAFAAYKAGL